MSTSGGVPVIGPGEGALVNAPATAAQNTVTPTADTNALILNPGAAGTASPLLIKDTNGTNLLDVNNASGSGPGAVRVTGGLRVFPSALNGGFSVSDGNGQRANFGSSANGRLSFNGAAVVAQPAAPVAVAVTAPTNVTPYGYTQAQATAIITAINALIAVFSAAGGGNGLTA